MIRQISELDTSSVVVLIEHVFAMEVGCARWSRDVDRDVVRRRDFEHLVASVLPCWIQRFSLSKAVVIAACF